jgi:hypothetical protein
MMQPFVLLAILTFGLIVVGLGIVLAVTLRKVRADQEPATLGKKPQGYWMGIGIALGLPIGYLLAFVMGVLMDETSSFVALGPALGGGLGIAIGSALEQKHKNEIRPLTEAEQKVRRWTILGGGLLVLLGVLALAGTILLAAR